MTGYFNYDYGYELLITHFPDPDIEGFGLKDSMSELRSRSIMNYLQETQKAISYT